jgi:hypothetical protein
MTARICGFSHSSTARPRWRGWCAILRLASYSMNTLPRMGRPCSPMRADLAPRASFRRRSMAGADPARPASGSAILPASPCSGSAARIRISDDRRLPRLPVTPRQYARKGIRQVALTITHLYLKSPSSTCQTRVGIRSNLDSVRESSGDRHLADLSRGAYGAISFHAFFVSSLAAAMFLCLNLAAGEASECVEKPDRSVSQQNTVEDNSIVVATVRSDVVLRAGPGAYFSAIGHVPRGTELETTDCIGGWYQVEFNGIPGFVGAADPGNDTAIRRPSARRAENRKLTSSKHLRTNKIASRERSQTKPPPATNGVANADGHDQLPGNGEKNEKPAPQLTDTQRQALFDDFLKWYLTVRLNP